MLWQQARAYSLPVLSQVVPLDKNVDPARARGNVEEWLVWLEVAMVQSIRSVTFNSTEAYTQSDYVDWIQVWPGQVREWIIMEISEIVFAWIFTDAVTSAAE